MSLNLQIISIPKNSLFKRLILALPIILLNACQTLPIWYSGNDPAKANKHKFTLAEKQSVIGYLGEVEIEEEDSLPLLARYFGLGFDEITQANPDLDPWLPELGHTVKLPLRFILPKASRKGVILNLAAKRLFYFPANKTNTVVTYPIGIGRKGWKTPTGKTTIIAKKSNPRWVVPKSILLEHTKKGDPLPRIVSAGPDNPLGEFALRLGIPGYLIHGTNKPYGVGMAISHGCVRLYPENIALLFKQTSIGMQVRIVNQPFLIGWIQKELYIQVYAPAHSNKKQTQKLQSAFKKELSRIEHNSKRHINWSEVDAAITRSDGIPVTIFANNNKLPYVQRFSHPDNLSQAIKPEPLTDKLWRLKVAKFTESRPAFRLAVMLNHQGPQIPAHVLPAHTGFVVVAGPFHSAEAAQSSLNRLRIDFELQAKLIRPHQIIPELQNTFSFFPNFLSVID
ncbi:MAG: L,D-transpeptidase family protein [Methylococcaceae bacterium]|nr:L,D-transpeptidase family protein [Methylococcaceae bacterium]